MDCLLLYLAPSNCSISLSLSLRECVGEDFQEELSDMLLLKMLKSAARASADKDRVRTSTERIAT